MVEERDMRAEKLPKGFTRRPSGSLRVQIRIAGHSELRTFQLSLDTADERRRQLAEAEAWAAEIRRKLVGGSHVSHREAEQTTLAMALRRLEDDGLFGDEANTKKERPRIATLLADPIAKKKLTQLGKTDVVALRDRLVRAGWLRNVGRAARRVEKEVKTAANKARLAEIRLLPRLREQLDEAKRIGEAGADKRAERLQIERQIKEVEVREDISFPKRTTIANVVQLVSRACKHAGLNMEGVPDLTGVPMPTKSPGRVRRVTDEELRLLLDTADDLMALIIRFAIATALRRERLLTCRTSHVVPIGGGRRSMVFPQPTIRKKRTGIIPLTGDITSIINEALRLQGRSGPDAVPDMQIFDLTIEAFESRWKRLLAATGIEDLTFHDFRHEATSRFFEQGLTTAEVMSITGHSTKDMVDRYSHYGTALVLKKLESGTDKNALLSEINFLVAQYKAAGGEMASIRALAV